MRHQYVDRRTGQLRDEQFFGDRIVRILYGAAREDQSLMLRALTSPRFSRWLGYLNFDFPLGGRIAGTRRFMDQLGAEPRECVDDPNQFRTARDVFERRIRYWDCRPMPPDPLTIVSPADARMVCGALTDHRALRIKERFFEFDELIGHDRTRWLRSFREGDFAVFRLTPEKYHYVHTPVAGLVTDHYWIEGGCHSCNPGTLVSEVGPLSKNRRVVTIVDTDRNGGSQVGHVAIIEVVALMIGAIEPRYSVAGYARPGKIEVGMPLKRGVPKSLFRPGSSTVVLLFEPGRMRFDADLVRNTRRAGARTRFAATFGDQLVETEIDVRASIGRPAGKGS